MKKFTSLFIALFLSLPLFIFLSFFITMTVPLEPASSARIFACTQCPKSKHHSLVHYLFHLTNEAIIMIFSVCNTVQSVSVYNPTPTTPKVAAIDDSFSLF